MDRLTGMAVFATVVEAGSFTAAAGKLGQSKSAVSKAVTRLEDRLGARLLNRTTRQLSLTEMGRAYYERAARVVAEAEEAELAVTRLQTAPRGTLRVNAPFTFGNRHLGPALPDFANRYPELTIDLTLNDRRVDVVEEGYDLVIRVGQLQDSALIARRITQSHRALCASPAYWDRAGRPSRVEELSDHACLIYSYVYDATAWRFERTDGSTIAVPVSGPLHANNGDLILHAAIAGLGIARLPAFICGEALADGRLEEATCDIRPPTDGIHALYPANRHLSAKVRAFVDFLVERFSSPGW